MAVLLGIDIETTGLNPDTDKILEIGTVLWDTNENNVISMASRLYQAEEIPPEITALTGITPKLTQSRPIFSSVSRSFVEICGLFTAEHSIDYLVAHNASFEQGFLSKLEVNFIDGIDLYRKTRWIDTRTNLPGMHGKSLSQVCYELGVFNPLPHRALGDALAMMQCLSKFDFKEVERYTMAPMVNLAIEFRYDAEMVEKVKTLGGWRWDSAVKQWKKDVKQFLEKEEREKAVMAGFEPFILAVNQRQAGETAV